MSALCSESLASNILHAKLIYIPKFTVDIISSQNHNLGRKAVVSLEIKSTLVLIILQDYLWIGIALSRTVPERKLTYPVDKLPVLSAPAKINSDRGEYRYLAIL